MFRMRQPFIVSKVLDSIHASWRWPLLLAGLLFILNVLLLFAVPSLIFAGRAIATEVASLTAPVGVYSGTVEDRRLVVSKVSFEPTLAGEQVVLQFANRLSASQAWGNNNHLPVDFQFSDTNPAEATLSFSGYVKGLDKPILRQYKTPNLHQIYVESHLGKVQVFLKRSKVGLSRVHWDEGRNRLTLQIQNYAGKLLKFDQSYTGLEHREVLQYTARGPLRIHVMEVDPSILEVTPVLANGKMGSKSSVMAMVNASGAIAGINASFFKQESGIPIGALILNDELVSGPLFNRVCFGIDQSNRAHMAKLSLQGNISIPDATAPGMAVNLPIDNVNQPRIKTTQTVVYTDRWGFKAPNVPAGGLQVLLVDGYVRGVSSDLPLPIPKGGLVVSGPMSQALGQLATLTPEVQVKSNFYTKPDWSKIKHAISGGPYLVQDGRKYIDLKDQQFRRGLGSYEPRSALGVMPNGKLLFVAVDGRSAQSVGVSLSELSQLMIELGSVEAMNLDGGSSTQMVLAGRNLNLVPAASVSTALVIRPMQNNAIAATAARISGDNTQ